MIIGLTVSHCRRSRPKTAWCPVSERVSSYGHGVAYPQRIARVTAVALALTAAAPCMGTTAAGSNRSTEAAAPAAAGHLVVLSDPGHVIYSLHPAGCHIRGSGTQILQD